MVFKRDLGFFVELSTRVKHCCTGEEVEIENTRLREIRVVTSVYCMFAGRN